MKKRIVTLFLLTGLLIVCPIPLTAQWSENPNENNQITPKDMTLYSTDFKVTPSGTTYYVINRPLNGNIVTSLQIIRKDGTFLYPQEGKTISQENTRSYMVINDLILVDKDNNALIAVQDCRNSRKKVSVPNAMQVYSSGILDMSPADEVSYRLYKVSPEGEMLWTEKGIDIEAGEANGLEAALRMIQLEDGSYVFAWMKNKGNQLNIRLQRRSNSGELIWNEELKEDQVSHQYPLLTNAGNNQFCLVYAKGSNQDIMVRKCDFDGTAIWPQDTRVYRGGFGSVPLHVILKASEDPNGGVFVGWYDDRNFTNKESTFVSYVKPDGSLAFSKGEEGEQVGYSEYRSFYPAMHYDQTENCLYIVWRETSGSQSLQRIMGQKMAMTGELEWGPEGIEIAPLSENSAAYYSIQTAGPGEFAAFYMLNHTVGYGDARAYVSRIDKNGNAVWNVPSMFTTCVSERSSLKSSPLLDHAYWLTLWKDERTFTEDPKEEKVGKTYMQKINNDGTLTVTSIEEAQTNSGFSVFPTWIEESASFIFTKTETGPVNLSIYTLSGQKAAVVFNGHTGQGRQEIHWDLHSAQLARGSYIATLTTSRNSRSVHIFIN